MLRSPRVGAAVLALVTAGIVLVPYATISLDFRRALEVQAITILCLVAALGLTAALQPGFAARRRRATRGMSWGICLYGLAAAWGAIVGLVAGNDLVKLAGQLLSLGLLPLGWASAVSVSASAPTPRFAKALIGATSAASAVHLGHWIYSAVLGHWVSRFYFGNAVSASAAALLAGLLILPRVTGPARRLDVLACFWLIVVLVFGSFIRGLWISFAFAVALFALLDRAPFRRRLASRLLAPLGFGALLAGAIWSPAAPRAGGDDLLLTNDLLADSPSLKQVEDGRALVVRQRLDGREIPVTRLLRFEPPLAVELAAEVRLLEGRGALGVQCLGPSGASIAVAWAPVAPHPSWRRVGVALAPPAPAERCRVLARVSGEEENELWLRDMALRDLRLPVTVPIRNQIRFTRARLASLLQVDGSSDPSIGYRLAESRALLDGFVDATGLQKVVGRGLGATYVLPGEPEEQVNYIHNFYLFLLYKLGIVGTCLVAMAFLLMTRQLWRGVREAAEDSERRRLAAAALAAWLAYWVWSVSSPEILDFRIAPLWGLLLGCLGREDLGVGRVRRRERHPGPAGSVVP